MNFLAELHPQTIHFPVAFFILYAILELLGILFENKFISKTALIILAAGVFTAVFAVLTGNQAEEVAENLITAGKTFPREILDKHESLATITLWFFTGVLILKIYVTIKKLQATGIKYLFIILAITGIYLIYETSNYGGDLVYKYGIGTELLNNQDRTEK